MLKHPFIQPFWQSAAKQFGLVYSTSLSAGLLHFGNVHTHKLYAILTFQIAILKKTLFYMLIYPVKKKNPVFSKRLVHLIGTRLILPVGY